MWITVCLWRAHQVFFLDYTDGFKLMIKNNKHKFTFLNPGSVWLSEVNGCYYLLLSYGECQTFKSLNLCYSFRKKRPWKDGVLLEGWEQLSIWPQGGSNWTVDKASGRVLFSPHWLSAVFVLQSTVYKSVACWCLSQQTGGKNQTFTLDK